MKPKIIQPKLKVGDKFVFTSEMNEAKKLTENYQSARHLIGRECTVTNVMNEPQKEREWYSLKEDSSLCVAFTAVDPFIKRFIW